MENENIYDKLMELFGKVPENFSILEEQVDIQTQMTYFEESKKIKEQKSDLEATLQRKNELFDQDTEEEKKKELLILLANLDDVEAYRAIEKFNTIAPDNLKDWTALSLQESRMTIESSLLDENQVIISTGLGGKDKKLRYFAVIAAKDEGNFTDLQQRLITKELEFTIKKNNGEIENVEFNDGYCLLTSLVPLNVSIKELITIAIEDCNQIGDFINEKFILTNVKVLSMDEIKESWNDATE
jgi:hypothetical protein